MEHLPPEWFQQPDVVQLAQQLVGVHLHVRDAEGQLAIVRITETEAYGPMDKACHAYNYRRTARTEVMFRPGGVAYVYLCYGIHSLLNLVTGPEGEPMAVLLRAGEPVQGVEAMLARRGLTNVQPRLTTGPGALTAALGLHHRSHNGLALQPETGLWLTQPDTATVRLNAGPRIGVNYAGEDALLPWRFWDADSLFVSKPPKIRNP